MKAKIIKFFETHPGIALKAKQIAEKLQIYDDEDYKELKHYLYLLFEEGALNRIGKKFYMPKEEDIRKVIGTLQVTKGNYGFVIPLKRNMKDIFVAERNMFTAMHGDKVEVTLFAQQKKSSKNLEGEVTKIIERKWKKVAGTLKKFQSFYYVIPEVKELNIDILINEKYLMGAVPGNRVLVEDITWDEPGTVPEGKISEILSEKNKVIDGTSLLLEEFGLNTEFPSEVEKEAQRIDERITDADIQVRRDFRNVITFTIDPVDAKDFDDALSLEMLPNGNFSIGIHIADVSHYIKRNSLLDQEALARGNSVYLVDRVIPMLPEKLSNDLCSLKPDEDKLTYSVIVELTPRGRLIGYSIEKTIIHSKRRFTYDEVQDIIEKGQGDFSDEVISLNKIAKILRKKRMSRGSINFESEEIKILLDNDGYPVRVIKRESKESHQLVEEFMLLANRLVAEHIKNKLKTREVPPFIYRIHDLPDDEKIKDFYALLKGLGYKTEMFRLPADAKTINTIMETAKGEPEEILVNQIAIRSMAKAIYSPDNIGHFGLGFKDYTHFTSPIRRYSDLIVHRILHAYQKSDISGYYRYHELESICEQVTSTERTAIDAERRSIKYYQTVFMKDKVGEEFDALISGVTNFGIFVEVLEILAEGLIRLRDLDDDYYVFDEKNHLLKGRRNKRVYRLGDMVRVKLVRVDIDRLEIDFLIADNG